jgi:hypothetical protein
MPPKKNIIAKEINQEPTKKTSQLKLYLLILGIFIIILIIVIVAVFLERNQNKINGTGTNQEAADINMMTSNQAYELGLGKAREWQADAVLAEIKSKDGDTSVRGRSDNWDLIFVSKNASKIGFHIIISNKIITKTEEIPFVAAGGEVPSNIISSEEAINIFHAIKGYETEPVISIEMIYGPDGKQWYWGVKTAKGTVAIKAIK